MIPYGIGQTVEYQFKGKIKHGVITSFRADEIYIEPLRGGYGEIHIITEDRILAILKHPEFTEPEDVRQYFMLYGGAIAADAMHNPRAFAVISAYLDVARHAIGKPDAGAMRSAIHRFDEAVKVYEEER